MSALYIFKRRTIGYAKRNPFRPRGQVKYGPWVVVSSHATLDEAREAQRKQCVGLYDRGIFYRGQRFTRGLGIFTDLYRRQIKTVNEEGEQRG